MPQSKSKIIGFALLATICLVVGFLMLNGGTVSGNAIEDIEEKIKQKEAEQKALREKAQQYQGEIESRAQEISSLRSRIETFDLEIQQLQVSINIKESEIDEKKLEIEKTELEIQLKEQTIEDRTRMIIQLLQALQRQQDTSSIAIILTNDSLSDFFDRIQARNTIQESLQEMLVQLRKEKILLENQKEELNIDKEELVKQQKELGDQQDVLQQAQAQQQSLLSQTRSSQARYQQLLAEAQAEEKRFRQEIFELEEELRERQRAVALPPGEFIWPSKGALVTQGYGCLSSGFAVRSYSPCETGSGKRGGFHNGVDIAAPLGTPVVAVDSGVVVAMSSSRYGYGVWVAVKHNNGLVSMYSHLSKITVTQGQHVQAGDKVGNMGSTGFSTGSHLHLVVYAPNTFRTRASLRGGLVPIGATVNPYKYLSSVPPGQRT